MMKQAATNFTREIVSNLSYDPTVDALTLRLSAVPVEESDEVAPGVILDYDEDGQVIGIEVLDVSKRAGSAASMKSVLQSRADKGDKPCLKKTK